MNGPVAVALDGGYGFVDQLIGFGPGAFQPVQVDKGGLAGMGIFLGLLAECFGGRFDIENVVGNLERQADLVGLSAQHLAVVTIDTGKQCPGLE